MGENFSSMARAVYGIIFWVPAALSCTVNLPEARPGQFQSFYKNNDPIGGLEAVTDWLCHDRVLLWLAYFSQAHHPQQALLAAKLAQLLDVDPARSQGLIDRITEQLATQAAQVHWPYRQLNRPIGELLNSGQITQRDLRWASQNAPHAQVREAAKTLLQLDLLHLQNPARHHQPAHVYAGKSYSARQERLLVWASGMLMGVYLTLFVPYMLWVGHTLITRQHFPAVSMLLLIGAVLLLGLLYKGMMFFLDRSINHRRGRLAEEELLGFLQSHLNQDWHLFSNLKMPSSGGDFDLVLVHASTIYMIEVKSWRGMFRVEGDQWLVQRKSRWIACHRQPFKQVKRNAVALKHFLQQKNIQVNFIQPVVAWLPIILAGADDQKNQPPTPLQLQSPNVPVVQRQDLNAWIQALSQESQGKVPVHAVVQCLSALVAPGSIHTEGP